MDPLDFDAMISAEKANINVVNYDTLHCKDQNFNTLENIARSDLNRIMTEDTLSNTRHMQTSVPEGHLPQHVVLPIFQHTQSEKKSIGDLQFFAVINGVQKGPFTLEQIKGLAIADIIGVDTMVWRTGLTEWVDLKTCLANLNVK